jgi:hypothetical protein
LVDKFTEVLDLDIVKLADTLSPLGTGKGGIMLPFDTMQPEGSTDDEEEEEADLLSSSDSEAEDDTSKEEALSEDKK